MQINLLPEKSKKGKATQPPQDFKKLILNFVFVWIILGGSSLILALNIGHFRGQFAKIQTTWETAKPLIEEKAYLSQRQKELNEFLSFIKQHVKKGIYWSEKLTVLSELVPEEVWFNEINLRKEVKEGQENTFLDVSASVGYLKTDEEMLNMINSFIERIKKDSFFFQDFQNLSLLEINKAAGKEKSMNFKFSLSLK
jgi:Tfp pilus assembly protein PilN